MTSCNREILSAEIGKKCQPVPKARVVKHVSKYCKRCHFSLLMAIRSDKIVDGERRKDKRAKRLFLRRKSSKTGAKRDLLTKQDSDLIITFAYHGAKNISHSFHSRDINIYLGNDEISTPLSRQ